MAAPAHGTKSALEEFLSNGKIILKKNGGVNETTIRALTRLATRLDLSKEELEASRDQLGLSRSDVREIIREGELDSERGSGGGGGGGGLFKVLVCLVLSTAACLAAYWSATHYSPLEALNADKRGAQVAIDPKDPGPQVPPQLLTPGTNPAPIVQPGPGPFTPPTPNPGANQLPGQPQSQPRAGNKLDERVVSALNSSAKMFPAEKNLFEQARDGDDANRGQAWQQLGGRFRSLVGNPGESDPVRRLLGVSYALEGEDVARTIRQGLLALLPPTLPRVPDQAADYDAAYWALHTAVDAARDPEVSPARSETLLNDLDRALNFKLDRSRDLAAFHKHAGDVLSQRFYTALNRKAKDEPDRCRGLRDGLVRWAKNYLDEDLMQEFNGEFNDALQKGTAVVNTPKKPAPKTEPAPVKPMTPGDQRLAQLRKTVEDLFARNRREQKPEQALQIAVELAHASTLTIALNQKDHTRFDALRSKKPVLPETVVEPIKPKEPPVAQEPKTPPQPVQPQPGFPGQPAPNFGGQGNAGFLGQPPPGQPGQQPFPGGQVGFAGQGAQPVQPVQFAGQQPFPQQPGAQPAQPQGFQGGAVPAQPPIQNGGGFVGQPAANIAGGAGQPPAQIQGGFAGAQVQGGFAGAQPPPNGGGFAGQPPPQPGPNPGGFAGQPPVQPGQNPGGFVGQPPAQLQGGLAGQVPGQLQGGVAGQFQGGIGGQMPVEQPKTVSPFNNRELTDMAVRALEFSRQAQERFQAITFLVKSSEEKELTTAQAESVARYLLAVPIAQEFEAVLPLVSELTRFHNLPLALADVFEEKATSSTYMEKLLTSLLREEVKLPRDPSWKKKARATLLGMSLPRAAAIPPGDAASAALRNSYAEQAKLLGFPDLDRTNLQTARALEAMIQSLSVRLARLELSREEKRLVERITDELLAARYVGVDDLHRTVLLQRLWARLLCMNISRQAPEQATQAEVLFQTMGSSLSQQNHVLRQLATGEEYILRLWLLLLPEPAATAAR